MADLSSYSNDQLMAAAGLGGGSDISSQSTESLLKIAGIERESTTPSLFSDPIGALGSADWWLTRPSGERISAKQAVVGAPLAALNSLTFGAGDEITAGANAAIDAMGPATFGEAYDQRLGEVRDIQNNTPLATQLITGLGGALKLPIPTSVSAADPLKMSALKLALEGAGYGGAYGFGSGEGGFANRLGSAGESAAIGGIATPALGVPLLAAQKGLGYLSSKAPEWAAGQDRKSLGARQGDYAKTANDLGVVDLPEGDLTTLTRQSLDETISSGVLGKSRDPAKMLPRLMDEETRVATQVAKLVEGYGGKVEPEFSAAERFLNQGKVPADRVPGFRRRLESLKLGIATEGGNSLPYIQQQKIALGTMWEPNDTVANGFTRAIYDDLKRTIEGVVPEVAPLNKELQKLKIAKPILQRGVAAEDAKDPLNQLIGAIKTSGGVGVPIITGALTGGIPGGVAGGALAAGVAAARTPSGRQAIGAAARSAGAKAGALQSKMGAIYDPLAKIIGAAAGSSDSDDRKPTASGVRSQEGTRLSQSSTYNNNRPTPAPTQPKSAKPKEPAVSLTKNIDQIALKNDLSDEGKAKITKALAGTESKEFQLLARAVVAQESSGKPGAVGKVVNVGHGAENAQGLMQVLPSTAKDIAKELGIKKYNLKDPTTNKIFGEYYLMKLLRQFGGDPELALAAYHSGPGRVENLMKITGAKDFQGIRHRLGQVGKKYPREVMARLEKLATAKT